MDIGGESTLFSFDGGEILTDDGGVYHFGLGLYISVVVSGLPMLALLYWLTFVPLMGVGLVVLV